MRVRYTRQALSDMLAIAVISDAGNGARVVRSCDDKPAG